MTYGPYNYCTCKNPYFPDQMCALHGWWTKPDQYFTGTETTDTWKWYEDKNRIKELEDQLKELNQRYDDLKAELEATDKEPEDLDGEPEVVLHNIEWLRESGLLWLINRQVFHPMGFALALVYVDDQLVGIQIDGDGKDTWNFHESVDENDLLAKARETLKPRES